MLWSWISDTNMAVGINICPGAGMILNMSMSMLVSTHGRVAMNIDMSKVVVMDLKLASIMVLNVETHMGMK